MRARLAMPKDRKAVLGLAKMQVEETLPHLDFHAGIAGATFDESVTMGHPTMFVAEANGKVIGYSMCMLEGYAFTTGTFVVQEVIYVRPDKRGTRAAAALLKQFIQWGHDVGAREWIMGISNAFQPERTARFMEHFGAERVGIYLKKTR